jgi:hypothetical protein
MLHMHEHVPYSGSYLPTALMHMHRLLYATRRIAGRQSYLVDSLPHAASLLLRALSYCSSRFADAS